MGVFATNTTNGAQNIFVKGAPEKVLERCKFIRLADGSKVALDDKTRVALDATLNDLSGGKFTYRCLGLATVDQPAKLPDIIKGINDGVNSVNFEVRE
jgi:Ca2+ transporting ATPase